MMGTKDLTNLSLNDLYHKIRSSELDLSDIFSNLVRVGKLGLGVNWRFVDPREFEKVFFDEDFSKALRETYYQKIAEFMEVTSLYQEYERRLEEYRRK